MKSLLCTFKPSISDACKYSTAKSLRSRVFYIPPTPFSILDGVNNHQLSQFFQPHFNPRSWLYLWKCKFNIDHISIDRVLPKPAHTLVHSHLWVRPLSCHSKLKICQFSIGEACLSTGSSVIWDLCPRLVRELKIERKNPGIALPLCNHFVKSWIRLWLDYFD